MSVQKKVWKLIEGTMYIDDIKMVLKESTKLDEYRDLAREL